jgi:DNA-binding MarR family transcriptional regulator
MCLRTHMQARKMWRMPRAGRKDDVVGVWSALLRLHAALVPVVDAEVTSATGTALGSYDILLELYAAPNHRLTMTELGNAVVLSRTRVSRVVDELEAAGHVTRVSHPDDRRSSYAQLTDAGIRVFRKVAPVYVRTIRSTLGELLSPEEAATVRSILEGALSRLAP